jgi:hypothetical protein
MKTFLLAMPLACMALVTSAQKKDKYADAKVKAQEKYWNDEKAEQYNDWEARPGHHEGYIIDLDSNKVQGIIMDNNVHSVKIVLPSGQTRRYSASKCLTYGFDNFRFVPMGNSFVELIYERESICVYKQSKYVTFTSGGPMMMTGGVGGAPMYVPVPGSVPGGVVTKKKSEVSEKYYLRRRTETEFVQVSKAGFASKFSKYFADCQYLFENIKNKTLGPEENDLTAIAAIYDRECAPGNKVVETTP